MKKDLDIQKNVMDELKWTPLLNANEIGVSVKNGIVTLSGITDSYPKKIKAERAVRNVPGVRGIAEDIKVRLNGKYKKTDPEIAQAVLNELEWHCNLEADKIKILVDDGCVSLEGMVDWHFQKKSTEKAIRNITGVREIINNIKVKAVAPLADIKSKIESSFQRNASLDAKKINIEVQGNKVILSGTVRSWTEKLDAEDSVWSASGVTSVENKLECEDEIY